MTKLTDQAVDTLVRTLLFTDDELVRSFPDPTPSNAVLVKGLVRNFGFHKERLEAAKPQISELLNQLPDQFHMNKGGGWTFLHACDDRNGERWTGLHRSMETLVCMGIAAGMASWQMREMVDILPGGVPYFEVHPEAEGPVQ